MPICGIPASWNRWNLYLTYSNGKGPIEQSIAMYSVLTKQSNGVGPVVE